MSVATKISGETRQNPMYRYLIILVVTTMAGFQGWRTLFNNFAVDVVGVNGFQVGIIQSLRELPGFLTFLVVYLLLIFREHRLSALSVLVFGIGVSITGLLPSFSGLIFSTVLMSIGFHYFETTNQSLSLQYFSHEQAPLVMTRLKSLGAMANIIVGALIVGLSQLFDLSVIYIIFGVGVSIVGVYCLKQDPSDKDIEPQQKKIVLKKKYWLFYVLNFLSGARRQIFVVFAVFMLVKKYTFSIEEVAVLFVLNNVITYFTNPLIGKWINKFGERKILTIEYVSLFFVFMGYALLEDRWLVAGLYILDHVFFNFSVAIKTFFQKTGEKRDIAPSMSVGFAINHISAVVIPVVGGLIWMYNWRLPFIVGALLSLVSLSFAQWVRIPAKR